MHKLGGVDPKIQLRGLNEETRYIRERKKQEIEVIVEFFLRLVVKIVLQ
jgi:hypothetical protein